MREDHLDIVWMVFLSRDDADPAWISCFSLTIWQMKKIMEKLDKINS